MKKKLITFLLFLGFILYKYSYGQVNLDSAASQVRSIGASAAGVVAGLVGLIGIGRAAYKFANGERDAIGSLIGGIVALVLGQIAATFL